VKNEKVQCVPLQRVDTTTSANDATCAQVVVCASTSLPSLRLLLFS
jgi:hypothetical protein